MAEKTECEICNKSFKGSEGLAMHNAAKHSSASERKSTLINIKRIKNWLIAIIVLGLLIWGMYAIIPEENVKELNVNLGGKTIDLPFGTIHWHPKLAIIIDGERIPIPKNIGITVGKIIDTHLSGMSMSPLHTHEDDGTIHLENNNPGSKPETVTLGYFFYVWDKQFNSTCLFETYCTKKGTLIMNVNGEESNESENYIMRDKDQIVIEYKSRENKNAKD